MTTVAHPLSSNPARESVSTRLVELVSKAPVHLGLILISVMWLVPTVGLLVTSFRARGDILSTGWWNAFIQGRFTLENYIRVLSPSGASDSLGLNFVNSVFITVPSTVLPVFLASLAAYAFAWTHFKGRDWIFMVIVGLLVVPLQMTFVPILQLYNDPLSPLRALFASLRWDVDVPKLQITSTYLGLWLAHTAYGLPFATYLLRSFFATLPGDLFDAAKIDGSSEFGIFTRIVLPLSVPALAAITIFQFLWVWNDLLVALIYAQSPKLQPLTVGINTMLSTYGPEWDILSAGAFLTMIVPLIVFFSLQRYFVTGLLAGSVKT